MKVYVVIEHEPLEAYGEATKAKIVCVTEHEVTARILYAQGRWIRTLECWEVDGSEVLL